MTQLEPEAGNNLELRRLARNLRMEQVGEVKQLDSLKPRISPEKPMTSAAAAKAWGEKLRALKVKLFLTLG